MLCSIQVNIINENQWNRVANFNDNVLWSFRIYYPPITVYPKKYAHGFCFAVLCCGYTLTDFPISIRLTSLALWQSNDCPSASKATLMNMDKYFMWIHYERLHNYNKAKYNKTVCIFLGIYCRSPLPAKICLRKGELYLHFCYKWTQGRHKELKSFFVEDMDLSQYKVGRSRYGIFIIKIRPSYLYNGNPYTGKYDISIFRRPLWFRTSHTVNKIPADNLAKHAASTSGDTVLTPISRNILYLTPVELIKVDVRHI